MLLLDNRVARNHVRMYALYTPLVLGVGFWFFTAPEPRFLGAILELSVALGAWLLCLSLSQHMALLWRYLRIPILLAVIAFGALALAYLFKLQTGLGLAQYFYISELLLALSRTGLDFLALIIALTYFILRKHSNLPKQPQQQKVHLPAWGKKMTMCFRYSYYLLVLFFSIGFASVAMAYIFNLETGLGLAQCLYIGDLLLLLSRADINAGLFLTVIASVTLLWLRKMAQPAQQQIKNGTVATLFAKTSICVLFLCFVIQFLAITDRFDISKLKGWHTIPMEPYRAIKLKSDLTVNVPVDGGECWNSPLPCTAQHLMHPELKIKSIEVISGSPLIKMLTGQP